MVAFTSDWRVLGGALSTYVIRTYQSASHSRRGGQSGSKSLELKVVDGPTMQVCAIAKPVEAVVGEFRAADDLGRWF